MNSNPLPDDFQKLLDSVTNKRARFVIDTILEKGSCSTEDLKHGGYEHAPRAARDVREFGIPLDTIMGKDSDGKQMAIYVFGDWEKAKKRNNIAKASGRTQFTDNLKKKLLAQYGNRCHLYGEKYPERLLQPDHRIPYEIGGDPDDMMNTDYFMLLSPSANRDKSWACEHCENWINKNIDFCKKCYYAYPEKYDHIAGIQEHRVNIIFTKDDTTLYEELLQTAKKENLSLQATIKRLLAYIEKTDE